MLKFISVGMVLLTPAFSSLAGVDLSLQACSQISEDAKRLQCFDQYIATQSGTASVKAEPIKAEPMTQVNTADVPKPLVLSSAPPETVLITGAVPPVDNGPSAELAKENQEKQIEQGFGLEHKKSQAEMDTQEMTFTITKAKKSPYGKWTLSFANGQKWATTSAVRMKFKQDQQVIISRGVFNSFLLQIKNSNRSVKVKRLN